MNLLMSLFNLKRKKEDHPPVIGKHIGRYYVVENITSNLVNGYSSIATTRIYQFCQHFPNDVILINQNSDQIETHACSLEGLTSLNISEGSKLTLKVENLPKTRPERIATKIARVFQEGQVYPRFEKEAKYQSHTTSPRYDISIS